ncbi:hypothetical protein [Pseudoclavibacter helvolus]|uniref:hypothetical protein n=1 Tax=Pseudoclavibacter helvolus TaxID=255205 RepID=UPI0012E8DA69|nr:hypothetical protein [Pseudoclavibacter helvolus]
MSTSFGVRKPRVWRGGLLSPSSITFICDWRAVISMPLGQYSRISPFVFSLLGRSHGEPGCANYAGSFVARVSCACFAMSLWRAPLPQAAFRAQQVALLREFHVWERVNPADDRFL